MRARKSVSKFLLLALIVSQLLLFGWTLLRRREGKESQILLGQVAENAKANQQRLTLIATAATAQNHAQQQLVITDHKARLGTIFPSGNEEGECISGEQDLASEATAAVVTITFDRLDYLQRHLDSLLGVHQRIPDRRNTFPLYISQDGKSPNPAVAALAQSFTARGISYLHHKESTVPEKLTKRENIAYYRISNHYRFIMQTFFDCFRYPKLIILEDDMEVSPDFFSYFEATARLLERDQSLYCISSWNDHGQARLVRNETQIERSDFFPGLGWMLTSNTWQGIRDDWPRAYWDDWMRLNKTRRGRQCLRPEVCRSYNFGVKGASKGQYHKRFLAPIWLNSMDINWTSADLSYLDQSRYDTGLNNTLHYAQVAATIDEAKDLIGNVVVKYNSQEHYEALAGRLGMLREWKDGIPRGGYRGVVMVHAGRAKIFLCPSPTFQHAAYDVNGRMVKVDKNGALMRKKGDGQT